MPEPVLTTVALLLVLGPLIFIHEFGHFLVAKLLGIRVDVFSFGFGPRILWFTWGQTEYRISLLPLGGYVKMRGENPDEKLSGLPDEFLSRSKWQRFLVLVMGASFNILLAIALLTVSYRIGVWEPRYLGHPVVVGKVVAGSPAESAGLRAGDRLLRMDGQPLQDWKDFLTQVTLSPGQVKRFVLDRDGERVETEIRIEKKSVYRIGYVGILPHFEPILTQVRPGMPAARAGLQDGDRILALQGEPVEEIGELVEVIQANPGSPLSVRYLRDGVERSTVITPERFGETGRIGIAAVPQVLRRYPIPQALRQSLRVNWKSTGLLFTTLKKLFNRELSAYALSGPIDIARFSAASFRQGLVPFLTFLAMVSLQLGIINLLPIPVLDGGHIFIILIEGVIRRDLSNQIKERVMQFGFLFLVTFMLIVIFLDLDKLFGWFNSG